MNNKFCITLALGVVALGVIAGVTNLVSLESLKKAVLARAPQGSEDLNTTALLVGYKEGVEYKKKHKIKDYNLNTLKTEEA
jgi:Pyruvate/2-oxoacid:ferredoxin oxidoreductase gamma subunit